MRILLGFLLLIASGCTYTPKDLKSPCVAIESPDGGPMQPCVRRDANSNWLG